MTSETEKPIEEREAEKIVDAIMAVSLLGTSQHESGYGPPFGPPWFIIDTRTAEPEVNHPGELIEEHPDTDGIYDRMREIRAGIVAAAILSSQSSLRERIKELEEALEFYADPETYFAIGFWPDRPCGAFIEDFDKVDDEWGERPGKRARAALRDTEGVG